MKRRLVHSFEEVTSVDNLLSAWSEFLRGKRSRAEGQQFQFYLMDNILALHNDLVSKAYRHGKYSTFRIADPKPRVIHKAPVLDRLLHHSLYRVLYPFFDKAFIADSYSCREGRGTHKALDRFDEMARKVSQNHTRTCWVLKCDIKQFFASVDHKILLDVLGEYIRDEDILWLCEEIVGSFHSSKPGVGLPLGNLTSQLFVNVYMNEFDQFMKHRLKSKYYIRYADDFVIMSSNEECLERQIPTIKEFLVSKLGLIAHKISIRTVASGVDFLGWVHFPNQRVLRTTTKKRMFRNIENSDWNEATTQSYLGLLKHGNTYKLQQKVVDSREINTN